MDLEKTVIVPFPGRERRASPRSRVELKVRVLSPTPRALTVNSLSTAGFFCQDPNPLPLGTRLLVELALGDGRVPMIVGARVARVQAEPGGMGVAFGSLQAQLRAALREQSTQ